MIDGHTHMLLGSDGPGSRRESVADLKEIDFSELFSRPTTLAWYLMMAKEYGVIDRVVWGSDYDVLWYPERGLAGYFEKVERETYWLRTELSETLTRCGWPTLSQSEIEGILGTNARRFLKLA